jgi:predicted RecA/RadA family phage recombinase
MAANFKREGKALHYLVPTGVAIKSGELVAVKDVVGVAITDGAEGELIALHSEGVFDIPVPALVGDIAQGKAIYYNATAKLIGLQIIDGYFHIGWAWDDGLAGGVVPVKLRF